MRSIRPRPDREPERDERFLVLDVLNVSPAGVLTLRGRWEGVAAEDLSDPVLTLRREGPPPQLTFAMPSFATPPRAGALWRAVFPCPRELDGSSARLSFRSGLGVDLPLGAAVRGQALPVRSDASPAVGRRPQAPDRARRALATLLLGIGAPLAAVAVTLVALRMASRQPDLAPLLIVAAAAGIAGLARPQWLVPAFAALTWTGIGAAHLGGFSPVELGGGLLLAVAVASAVTRRQVAREALVVMALLALPLLATSLVSTEGSGIPIARLRDLGFIFLIALTLRAPAGVQRTAMALAAVGIFLGLGAVYSVAVRPTALFTLQPESELNAPRAAGPLQDANFFALAMAALLPFALYAASRPGAARVLGYGSALCLFAGVLATGSRGGIMASILGVLVFGVWARQRRVLWASLAVVAVAAAALLPLFAAQVEGSKKRSVSGRANENRIAVAMFLDHPIAGTGPGTYPSLYRVYARRIGDDPRPVRAAHSLPLQVAAEQGVVGLAGWLGVILAVATLVRRRRVKPTLLGRALLTAFLVYGVGSLFLSGSQLRLPYILIGLVLAYADAEPTRTGDP